VQGEKHLFTAGGIGRKEGNTSLYEANLKVGRNIGERQSRILKLFFSIKSDDI